MLLSAARNGVLIADSAPVLCRRGTMEDGGGAIAAAGLPLALRFLPAKPSRLPCVLPVGRLLERADETSPVQGDGVLSCTVLATPMLCVRFRTTVIRRLAAHLLTDEVTTPLLRWGYEIFNNA